MSKYINQFEVVKNYISDNYVKNENFFSIEKDKLLIDVRFNTNSKLKIIQEVLDIYIKKNILKEVNGIISLKAN